MVNAYHKSFGETEVRWYGRINVYWAFLYDTGCLQPLGIPPLYSPGTKRIQVLRRAVRQY